MSSNFSIKATFDGKELVQGFKDVKKEVEGLEAAGEDAKKSLDQMLQQKNSTTNYKRQLSQITAELNDLAVNYAKLSDAEKQSEFGQAMSKRIDELTSKAQELKSVFDGVNQSLKGDIQLPEPDVKVWDGMAELIEAAASGFQTYAGMLGMSEESAEALTKTIAKMATIQAGANTVVKIGKMLQKESNLVMAVTKVQTLAAAAAINIKTAAEVKNKAATLAATVAQKGLNAVAKANPYVLLASVLISVGAAIYKFVKESNKAEAAEKAHKEALEKAAEAAQNWRDKVSNAISGPLSQYKLLQAEYKSLRTEHAKKQWINNNKDAFEELGLSVTNLKSAEDAFVNNTGNVVQALIKRATATAKQQQLTELAGKYMDAQLRAEEEYQKKQKKFGDKVYSSNHNAASGDEFVDRNGNWVYTEQGARKANATIKKQAYAEANKIMAEMTKLANELAADMPKAIKPTTSGSTKTSSSTVIDAPEVFNEKSLKYAQQKVAELQGMLDRMATDSPDFEPTLKQLHEWQAAVATIQDMMKKPEVKEPEVKIEISEVVEEEVEEAIAEIVTLEDAINSVFDAFGAVGNVVSSVNSIYESFKNLPEALAEAENGWERFMVGFDAAMSILNVFTTTMSTINTLMTAFNTLQEISTALKLKDVAASGAKVTADSAAAGAAGAEAAANTAAATAGAAKAVSWLPIVGPILAVAAIAAVIGGILAARSKGKYASGGIIPGSSKIGDFNIARVNGGEMILNTRQQANLFSMLDKNRLPQSSVSSGEVTFRIQGDTLVGVIDNYNKKRSRI